MKRKIMVAFIVLLLIFSIFAIRPLALHWKYAVPNQAYFGKNYHEIFRYTSLSDRKIAKAIIEKMDDAFSFIGTEQEAAEKFGLLSRYSVKNQSNKNLKETHHIKCVAAAFQDDSGYIWIEYSREVHTDNGELDNGSWNILARMELEKTGGEWNVIHCKEHP